MGTSDRKSGNGDELERLRALNERVKNARSEVRRLTDCAEKLVGSATKLLVEAGAREERGTEHTRNTRHIHMAGGAALITFIPYSQSAAADTVEPDNSARVQTPFRIDIIGTKYGTAVYAESIVVNDLNKSMEFETTHLIAPPNQLSQIRDKVLDFDKEKVDGGWGLLRERHGLWAHARARRKDEADGGDIAAIMDRNVSAKGLAERWAATLIEIATNPKRDQNIDRRTHGLDAAA